MEHFEKIMGNILMNLWRLFFCLLFHLIMYNLSRGQTTFFVGTNALVVMNNGDSVLPTCFVEGSIAVVSTGSIENAGGILEMTENFYNLGTITSNGIEIFSGSANQILSGNFSGNNYLGDVRKRNIGNLISDESMDCNTFDFETDGTMDLKGDALLGIKSTSVNAMKNFSDKRFVDVGNGRGFLKRAIDDTSGNAYAFPLGNSIVGYQRFDFEFSSLNHSDTIIGTLNNHPFGLVNFDTTYSGFSGGYPGSCMSNNQSQTISFHCLAEPLWSFWGPVDCEYVTWAHSSGCDAVGPTRVIASPISSGNWNAYISDVSGSFAENMCEYSDWSGIASPIPGGKYRGIGKDFAIASGGAVPLSVELIYLRAESVENRFIKISWQTAIEINNAGFIIERSLDGISFDSIGFVVGNGNTTTVHDYSHDDGNVVFRQIYYYRLRQIDFDGGMQSTHHVSAMITDIPSEDPFEVRIILNGSSTPHSAVITSVIRTILTLDLLDVMGKSIWNETIVLELSETQIPLDFSRYAPGVYVLKITDGNYYCTNSILKI